MHLNAATDNYEVVLAYFFDFLFLSVHYIDVYVFLPQNIRDFLGCADCRAISGSVKYQCLTHSFPLRFTWCFWVSWHSFSPIRRCQTIKSKPAPPMNKLDQT